MFLVVSFDNVNSKKKSENVKINIFYLFDNIIIINYLK